jgi:hypothetical protein
MWDMMHAKEKYECIQVFNWKVLREYLGVIDVDGRIC